MPECGIPDLRDVQRVKQAQTLRAVRKVHRTTAIMLFFFFFLIASTGIILGWKKNSNGKILPDTYRGTSTELRDWLPVDSLYKNACKIMRDSLSSGVSVELDRMDIRPDKGSVKFIFTEGYREIQLDGATGKLLHMSVRYSDLIENIHDGTIFDRLLGIRSGLFKVGYTSLMGIALLTFTLTGFWLWYGPKRMRRSKRSD
jgi:uncharacterized iron-regulated membrane protein